MLTKLHGNNRKFAVKAFEMKRVLLLALMVLALSPALFAEGKGKSAKKNYVDSTSIEWLDWDEVQARMKKEPRKVWVDVYTDWCGWCKRMDNTTFKNKEVIKYMNEKFYAVKFNAEKQDSIRFMGNMYYLEMGTSQLATELMRGQMSYPTFIFMEENFQNHFPIPGYQPVDKIEGILKFLGENTYKTMKWEEFQQDFTPAWAAN